MERKYLLLVMVFIFVGVGNSYAIHQDAEPTKPNSEEVLVSKSDKSSKKAERRMKRIQKKEATIKKKLARKGFLFSEGQRNVLDNSKFLLGALLVGGAIGLGLLAALGILRGLLGWLAGVFVVVGLVFLIWGLIEYYN